MTVNNYFLELLLMDQKILTNPQQVLFTLRCKRNARSHSGMNEMKVTTGEGSFETCKEMTMVLWKGALESIREPCSLIWIGV